MSVPFLLFVIAVVPVAIFWELFKINSRLDKHVSPPYSKCQMVPTSKCEDKLMTQLLGKLWTEDEGQDIAEYAVMLAVILVLVVGTIRLVGSSANTVFSNVASTMQ